jgi:hypothetical protein
LLALIWLPMCVSRAADVPPLQRCDFAGYQQHLQQLAALLHTCAEHPSAATCNSAAVGPDDEVATSYGTRMVHYGWLRRTLATAQAASLPGKPGDAARVQLAAATLRLAQDSGPSSAPVQLPLTAPVRTNLDSILAERRFQRIQQAPSLLQRAFAAVMNWLFERLGKVVDYGARNPWIARLLEVAAIVTPCVLLTWWVMVRLRRQAAAPKTAYVPAPNAPSAREWQRWLAESEAFAQAGRWRDAVHHIYWAAISRLEAHGLWPADRARTPREYLRLLGPGHALQPDLRGLTRSFELIWYGNRPAAEEQYRDARTQMERLAPR